MSFVRRGDGRSPQRIQVNRRHISRRPASATEARMKRRRASKTFLMLSAAAGERVYSAAAVAYSRAWRAARSSSDGSRWGRQARLREAVKQARSRLKDGHQARRV